MSDRTVQESIGARLDRCKGIGPGFDFLRIALALSILAFHSFVACGVTRSINASPAWIWVYGLLPMFFALSGFLITGSAMRLRLRDFLINRGIRILPALAVEIVLSAILLGPIFTTFSLSEYFTDPKFAHYFTNIVGFIRYQLPGVFLSNPLPDQVNVSLWTVPYEVVCYVVMSGIIVFGILRRPVIVAAMAAVLLVAAVLAQIVFSTSADGLFHRLVVHGLLLGRGGVLLPAFLLGSLIFLWRHHIPYDWRIFAGCVGLCAIAAMIGGEHFVGESEAAGWRYPGFLSLVFCPPLAYMTAFIGVSNIPPVPGYSKGDYSYGIYLYGFPVQQSLIAVFPHLTLVPHLLLSVVLSSMVAVGSWHFIEKPILRLRKRLTFMARKVVDKPQAGAIAVQPGLVRAVAEQK